MAASPLEKRPTYITARPKRVEIGPLKFTKRQFWFSRTEINMLPGSSVSGKVTAGKIPERWSGHGPRKRCGI
jgi:hypothetical protein